MDRYCIEDKVAVIKLDYMKKLKLEVSDPSEKFAIKIMDSSNQA